MNGLTHVALHVGLCGPISRLRAQTAFAMHVRVSDRIGRPQVDRTYSADRGYGEEPVVEFDVPRGLYRLQVSVPKYGCSASDFVFFIPDQLRNIKETLASGPSPGGVPLLLTGTTPAAFSYAQPEFVALDRNAPCNQPISNPIPLQTTIEKDEDAYYAQFMPQLPDRAIESLSVVMKLRTATGEYHYVRIPVKFPVPATPWPSAFELNIPEGYLDSIATDPIDTLLCPKFTATSVS